MLRSLYSGVSGLRNHQQSMDVIGNNIANVNTPGYKSSRVTFMDTLSQTLQGVQQARATMGGRNPMQIGSGMSVAAVDKNMGQGSIQSTGRTMDIAIEGKGFFIVGNNDDYLYTRVGAMSVDDNGNLVTNTGERVYGWVDTNQDGVIDASQDELQWINLDRRGDGQITNAVAYASPVISGANEGDASLGDVITETTTVTDRWSVVAVDNAGGSVLPGGDPVVFTVTGERSGPVTNSGTGSLYFEVGDTFENPSLGSFTVNGGVAAQASRTYDFGGGTTLTVTSDEYGAGGNDINITFVTKGVNQSLSVAMVGNDITVNLATDAAGNVTSTVSDVAAELTAQADSLIDVATAGSPGTTTVPTSMLGTQYLANGAGPNVGDSFSFSTTAPGGASVENITFGRDGTVVGTFENGTTEEIARVALGAVPNPEGLFSLGGGKFAETPTSGSGLPPTVAGTDGTGTITAGYLEMSNVDLTREFTDLIVTQRGFQANSRVITTSDEMLQELMALKR